LEIVRGFFQFLRFRGDKKPTFEMSKEELKQVSADILTGKEKKPFPEISWNSLWEEERNQKNN